MQNWPPTNTRSSKNTSRPRTRAGGDREVRPGPPKSPLLRAEYLGGRGRRGRTGRPTETYEGSTNASCQGLSSKTIWTRIEKILLIKKLELKFTYFKIWLSMVLLSKNEGCLHNFGFRSFKCLSGNVGCIVNMPQK